MKFSFTIIILVFLQFVVKAQGLPNDCVNYIQVCGNYDISLNVSGAGIQEIGPNVCQSQEHNSLWLQITIKESGTLGFTLKPESSSIEEDYDFWIFGPDMSCGNLGEAIRCSTTNPAEALQGNNHTGLNESSSDISQGPGPDGDSFLKWLNVVAGEKYFLVIDRPIGYSAFQLTWTGSAVLDNPLLNYEVYSLDEIYICDANNDRMESYDFSIWNTSLVDRLDNIQISYHQNESDALIGINPLNYPDTVQHGTYFARIKHVDSKCFDIIPFHVNMSSLQLDFLEVIDENQIIAHHNTGISDGLYFSLNDGQWQSSNIFMNVPNGLNKIKMKYGECTSDELFTYIFKTTNVITPNGDGLNDVWELKGLENLTGSQLYIYDRYGKQILNRKGGGKAFIWDGTFNGRRLSTGTYWYHIILPDGRTQKGHITLLND